MFCQTGVGIWSPSRWEPRGGTTGSNNYIEMNIQDVRLCVMLCSLVWRAGVFVFREHADLLSGVK